MTNNILESGMSFNRGDLGKFTNIKLGTYLSCYATPDELKLLLEACKIVLTQKGVVSDVELDNKICNLYQQSKAVGAICISSGADVQG